MAFCGIRSCILALIGVVASLGVVPPAATQNRPRSPPKPSFAEPGISPDGSEIAFVSGSDIWGVAASGGEARLLVSHPATESRPLYSPDSRRLAFVSNRSGSPDIWLLTFATGELTRLTCDDGSEQLDGWSRDGRWIYYSSSSHDVAGMNDIYRVSAEGGTPMQVSADRYMSEFFAAPSPDGVALALVARGNCLSQWWRNGRSHLDESELWLMRPGAGDVPQYEKLLGRGAKQQWPMWAPDGKSLYFISDRNGVQNVWVRTGQAAPKQITHYKDGRVLWPSMSLDGRAMVFERNFGIHALDLRSGQTREVPITLRGASALPTEQHVVMTSGFNELALAPDGRKVAFIARGEVFAASATDGGDAVRITRTPAVEAQLRWAPDSRRLLYASNRDGAWHVYGYDFGSNRETQLTSGPLNDTSPVYSPDGKMVAFFRDGRELRILDTDTKQERVLGGGHFGRPPFLSAQPIAWSPDSRWVAYLSGGTKLFINVHVAAVEGGASQQATFLSNTRGSSVSWSPDGTFLLIDSGMRTETGILARLDLLPHVPKFREDQFRDLFREDVPGKTSPPAPSPRPAAAAAQPPGAAEKDALKPVQVVFEGIRQRLTVLPVGIDVEVQAISPDGKQALITAAAAGQQNLYTFSLDELAAETPVARQLTSTAGRKSGAQFAPDGKTVFYLEQGRISSVSLENRTVKPLSVRVEMDADFSAEKHEVFHQAWEFLNDNFYDPRFHGVDWPAVRMRYSAQIAGARTADEMWRLLNMMVGEMNASHMGISPPQGGNQPVTGRIGLHFARVPYEERGEMRVEEVIPLSPAAIAGVRPGEYLIAVDGTGTGARTNLDALLMHKIGRQVKLTVAADAAGRDQRDVVVRPSNGSTEKGLLYRAWVEHCRAYVAKVSGGRLGYIHMLNMGGDAIAQMNLDLDSENHAKEGVVLDLRNNSGGFVNGYALDVLSRQNYVLMVRRGVPPVPGRPVLGQRSLEKPTILVINQHTLSDGENFTEGYRVMKLGKVVGEPTAGWDVYTGSGTMVDGTSVRLPFMKNASLDESALELVSRKVDVTVDRALGDAKAGKDAQLDAAVRELLAQIDKSAKP